MKYDPDANIISLELSKDPIINTVEFGNFIMHLSPSGKPVLIEILNGSKFVGKLEQIKKIIPDASVKDANQAISAN